MQILTTAQIRQWDAYTILHTPISSLHLMERAAAACFNWLMDHGYEKRSFAVFCGKGNNGGDGLAVARMLIERGLETTVYILESGNKESDDFRSNLSLLNKESSSV